MSSIEVKKKGSKKVQPILEILGGARAPAPPPVHPRGYVPWEEGGTFDFV